MRELIYTINLSIVGCCDHTKMMGDKEIHEYFAQAFDSIDKIVFSQLLDKAEDKKTRIVRTKPEEEILKLKQEPGQNIFLDGVALPSHLIKHSLGKPRKAITKLVIALFCILIMSGCGNILNRSQKVIWFDKDNQYVITTGLVDSCNTLSRNTKSESISRTNCIIKVGWNDHFIIGASDSTHSAIHYWIINKDKDKIEYSANQIVEGPFNLAEFDRRKMELGISSLKFEKVLDSL